MIVPALEYIMTNTILSEQECNKIISPLRTLCKHKCGLAQSINNNIVHHPNILNITDLFYHQLSCQWSLFQIQSNNSSDLATLSKIRTLTLLNKYWSHEFPLSMIQLRKKFFYQNNLIETLVYISKNFPLNVSFTRDLEVRGGSIPLSRLLPNYHKHISSLRSNNILYLDQVLTVAGSHLEHWNSLKLRFSISSKRPYSWFKWLEHNLIFPLSRLIPSSILSSPSPFASNYIVSSTSNLPLISQYIAFQLSNSSSIYFDKVISFCEISS